MVFESFMLIFGLCCFNLSLFNLILILIISLFYLIFILFYFRREDVDLRGGVYLYSVYV